MNTNKDLLRSSFKKTLGAWAYDIQDKMPDKLYAKDLVNLGLYRSYECLKQANHTKTGPAYTKDGKHCVYDKRDVMSWLLMRANGIFKAGKQ